MKKIFFYLLIGQILITSSIKSQDNDPKSLHDVIKKIEKDKYSIIYQGVLSGLFSTTKGLTELPINVLTTSIMGTAQSMTNIFNNTIVTIGANTFYKLFLQSEQEKRIKNYINFINPANQELEALQANLNLQQQTYEFLSEEYKGNVEAQQKVHDALTLLNSITRKSIENSFPEEEEIKQLKSFLEEESGKEVDINNINFITIYKTLKRKSSYLKKEENSIIKKLKNIIKNFKKGQNNLKNKLYEVAKKSHNLTEIGKEENSSADYLYKLNQQYQKRMEK